jgi:hypothetical protein
MTIEVTSDIEVRCAPSVAFAVLADMARNPEWQKGMRSCEWTSAPPLRVGSTYDQEASFLGRTIRTSFEVTEFVADERIRIVSTVSTFPIDVTRTVESVGEDRTRISAVVRGEPGRVFGFAGPLMRAMVGRSVRGDYRRLKALLEGGQPE